MQELGAGGMGAVYLVVHRELNSRLALKVLSGPGAALEDARRRFKQEGLVAAALGDRVARPIDIGELPSGVPYLLMEYLEGGSLADELRVKGPLKLDRALQIAAQVAETLTIAHGLQILHRDIKPANIMLTSTGTRDLVVKIVDFGVAQAGGALKVAHTRTGTSIGTLGYMPPEAIAAAHEIDGRCDVFSLGVVLYQMLTGALPLPLPLDATQLLPFLLDPIPPIATRRPQRLGAVPQEVEQLIQRALERERDLRPFMAEFHEALSAVLQPPLRASPLRPMAGRPPAALAANIATDATADMARVGRVRHPRRWAAASVIAVVIATLCLWRWPPSSTTPRAAPPPPGPASPAPAPPNPAPAPPDPAAPSAPNKVATRTVRQTSNRKKTRPPTPQQPDNTGFSTGPQCRNGVCKQRESIMVRERSH